MQPVFGLSVFLSEASILPVTLQDASGNELTGYVASSVTLEKSLNGAAMTTLTPTSWTELGHGLYEALVPGSEFSAEGILVYRGATNPQGTNPAFNGCAQIVHRLDDWEVVGSPQYDEVTQDFTCMVALRKNGALVSNPASCQIWLTDVDGVTPVNLTSVLPNADGVFVLTQAEIVLALNMNYELKLTVTDADGVVHSSVDFAITFN
jgi:hypothetical protein